MKILSTVKYKVALASTALFVSASSFAAEGATGGTDYAGQALRGTRCPFIKAGYYEKENINSFRCPHFSFFTC